MVNVMCGASPTKRREGLGGSLFPVLGEGRGMCYYYLVAATVCEVTFDTLLHPISLSHLALFGPA
jgi:hypothetical protein